MKNNSALNWIVKSSKKELGGLVLLVIGNALYSACGVSMAVFAKYIIDSAVRGDRDGLLKYAVILLAVIAAQIALRLGCKALEVRISGKLEMKYKSDLFSQILKKDYLKISEFHSGELLTRLTSDVNVVSQAVTTIVPSLAAMLTRLVCAFAVLFHFDKKFALLFLLAGVVLFVFTRIFRGSIKKLHRSVQETDGEVRSFMQEAIESLLVVKIFGVASKIRKNADGLQQENYKAKIRKNRWSIFANLGFSAAFSLGYLFGLVWGGLKLCAGTISFGTLTAIIQLIGQVQTPFTGLSGIVPQYYSMLSSAERIIEIENMQQSKAVNSPDVDTKKLYDELDCIRFDGVSFSYDRDTVLENGSFDIKKNDFIMISGISGIGKSTLFKLLVGVLPVDEGKISIISGGSEYAVDKYTRPLFAYVPQGNMLFSGTIRDNLRFVNDTASDEEIMKAAVISCADEFIKELPDGLDTVLLENGHGLSEGQVQRLAIARAVLTGAPILLLDEATSALDEATEKQLLENIRGLNEKTCIIISHKSAAYEICNKELKIEDKGITLRNLD
ncbi:MAG: ABC transporter ATP-binding protein [Clostridiaceae bacterium]|nr:ABC transporter ATP-binding protein [Clostridiaceae bacterium]